MEKLTTAGLKWMMLTGVAVVIGLVGAWLMWEFNLGPFAGSNDG